MHPANHLTSDGNFCGVVDFSDMCAGDPAFDLAAGWLHLPEIFPLADVCPGTVVVLGLLTTKSGDLDDETDVAARISEANQFKPLPELALSTKCGFASVPSKNRVTPAGQRARLEMVARLAYRT